MRLILVGAFHEMIELCEDAGHTVAGIIDNTVTGEYYGIPVIGKDEDASAIHERYPDCPVIITPDKPFIREKLVEYYSAAGFSFATVIHPGASISRFATVGEGTVIQKGVIVSANSVIGRFCKLNSRCHVTHDCAVADFSTVAPDAVLLGYVSVGVLSYIGSNSTILPYCKIGERATVGAGAVITKDIDSAITVAGVPARILEKD